MKRLVRRSFDPAIEFLNRYSFPRKFVITGTLVVLPLLFVTSQYIETLNERVELSQRELVGNQTIRALTPLWRTLNEIRLAFVVAEVQGRPQPNDVTVGWRERLQQQLDELTAADADHLHLLQQSTRWVPFQARLQFVLTAEPGAGPGASGPGLSDPELLSELIADLLAIRRHVADLSQLSVDPQLDSQNLAVGIATLIPDLVDTQDRLRDSIAKARVGEHRDQFDLELAELNGGLRVQFDRVQQRLSLSMQRNPDVGQRLQGALSIGGESVRRIESGIHLRQVHSDEAPSLGEIDSQAATSLRETLALLEAGQDAFDEVVEKRTELARSRRLWLLVAALVPLIVAAYLVVGLCLAIIQTADQMRDVTDCILLENGSDRVRVTIEAQDELGRMVEHFGRIAMRLREELVLAQAEAVRASTAEESLRVNQERFNLVLRGANDGIWDWDLHTDRVFYSDRFKELLGYESGEFGDWLSALADILHHDDFDMTWKAIEKHFQDRKPYHIEHRLRAKSGEYRWFLDRGQAVWDENGVPIRMAGSIKDITVRKATEARDQVRNRVLELLATGASLSEVLDPLARSFESENSQLRCSILILDKKQMRLFTAAGPGLPDYFNEAIDGLGVGMGIGACGTAAFLGQRVVVKEIATHPYCTAFVHLAQRVGVASCCSEPIRGISGRVLGTIAIFGTNVGAPTESDLRLIEVAANLAGIAIERKQVDEALVESEERWKFALEGAGDGVWDWNLLTDEMLFSRRWSEMLGFDEGQLPNSLEGWESRIHPEDLVDVLCNLRSYLDGKTGTYMHEHRMLCQDGSVKWILSRGIVVSRDSAGKPLRMIGTHSDITDRKRIEEDSLRYLQQVEASRDRITNQSVQLIRQSEELALARDQAEAAARAKSEFLANMSHELRTPLTAILGYADLLYEDEIGGGGNALPRRETLDIIRSNGRHLQELIDDILDLSKIDADRMTLELVQVSPRQLVEDVLRLMQLKAGEKGLSLQADYCFPLPDRITTDALRVRQILVNLIGNAIKFTERGTIRVTIRYDAAAQRQVFAVEDSGIGINPEQMQRLFSPFSQADASMSRRFGGTGLGLSISKKLAQMLGGDITVASTFGFGSTFTLEITAEICPGSTMFHGDPVKGTDTTAAPTAGAVPAAGPVLRLTGRILLAEDVPANQKLIAFLLQKWGATVQVVDNGALAVDAALEARDTGAPFDLILMDIQMPEMDGYTATGLLRQRGYSGRIIALTAHASDDDRNRCLNSGFDGFAVKPIQKDQLYATCREHLDAVREQAGSSRRHADAAGEQSATVGEQAEASREESSPAVS